VQEKKVGGKEDSIKALADFAGQFESGQDHKKNMNSYSRSNTRLSGKKGAAMKQTPRDFAESR